MKPHLLFRTINLLNQPDFVGKTFCKILNFILRILWYSLIKMKIIVFKSEDFVKLCNKKTLKLGDNEFIKIWQVNR